MRARDVVTLALFSASTGVSAGTAIAGRSLLMLVPMAVCLFLTVIWGAICTSSLQPEKFNEIEAAEKLLQEEYNARAWPRTCTKASISRSPRNWRKSKRSDEMMATALRLIKARDPNGVIAPGAKASFERVAARRTLSQ